MFETLGVAGVAFTTTTVVAGELAQPLFAITVYVPADANTALATVGFCKVDVNPFGPVQLYVAPAMVLAVRFIGAPVQTGVLLPAVGVAGKLLTVTTTVPAALVHPPTVIVSEYVPSAASVTEGIEGFCKEDEKLFGPVQLYVAPATAEVVKFNVAPTQSGLLLDGEGVGGVGNTVTVVVPAAPVQPFTVTVTEYVPAPAAVIPAILGFWTDDVNPFGPVQLYVAPATVLAVKFNVAFAHTGELLPAVGAAGVAFTTTVVVPAGLVAQPGTVAVTE